MTDKEWNSAEQEIESDRKAGKPDISVLSLHLPFKSLEELKELRKVLSRFYGDYVLSLVDDWISWKEKSSK